MGRIDNQGKKMTSLRSPLWRRLLDLSICSFPSPLLRSYLWQQAPGWQTWSVFVSVYVRDCTYTRTIWTGSCGQLDSPASPESWREGNGEGVWQEMEIIPAAFWIYLYIVVILLPYYYRLCGVCAFVACQRQSWVQSGRGRACFRGVREGKEKQPGAAKAGSLFGLKASGCFQASLACLQQYLWPFFGRWE